MVIILNGYPTSGKDTFANLCIEILKRRNIEGWNISTVDKIKDVAKQLRWNGEKDAKSRKFLSDLKDLYTEYCNGPLLDIEEFVSKSTGVVFVHCREPKEIQKIVDNFKGDVYKVKVNRNVYDVQSNHADSNVDEIDYDYIIDNVGDINLLKKSCETFLNEILK